MDRFDICEVWSVLAHDYGLYGIQTRLDKMGFKSFPMLRYATLNDEQLIMYAERQSKASRTGPYSYKIGSL